MKTYFIILGEARIRRRIDSHERRGNYLHHFYYSHFLLNLQITKYKSIKK